MEATNADPTTMDSTVRSVELDRGAWRQESSRLLRRLATRRPRGAIAEDACWVGTTHLVVVVVVVVVVLFFHN